MRTLGKTNTNLLISTYPDGEWETMIYLMTFTFIKITYWLTIIIKRAYLVVKIDQDWRDWLQHRNRRNCIAVFFVPRVQQDGVDSHWSELVAKHLQLRRQNIRRNRTVAILLAEEHNEIWSHREALTILDLLHAQLGCHVIVGGLVTDAPTHVDDLCHEAAWMVVRIIKEKHKYTLHYLLM